MKEQFYTYIQNLQDQIIAGLEAVRHAKFREDLWERLEGGVVEPGYRKWSCFEKRRSKCFCGAW
jgi:coproporphyrinogen III oxidase